MLHICAFKRKIYEGKEGRKELWVLTIFPEGIKRAISIQFHRKERIGSIDIKQKWENSSTANPSYITSVL
jgi:hypothetical protein